jgi:integrase
MRVFKTTYKDRNGQTQESAKWYIEFRDHQEIIRRLPAFTDKKQSEELGRKIEKLVAYRSTNDQPDLALSRWLETMPPSLREKLAEIDLLDPQRIAASKALAGHLTDYKQFLLDKANTQKHVDLTVNRIQYLFDQTKVVFMQDLSPSTIQAFLASLKKDGRSNSSCNHYLRAIKMFCNWLVKDRRIPFNPLACLSLMNEKVDRKHQRRALTLDEIQRLLTTTGNGAIYQGIEGTERRMIYLLALTTGLRASEIKSLTRAGFDFSSEPAKVTVKAAYTKNGDDAVLPLRPDVAEELKSYLANKLPTADAFRMPKITHLAQMVRFDLDAAEIMHTTDLGIIDFHSLRHTFLSMLAKSGVHPKVAQALARHSTITLTMDRYTHVYMGEQTEALAKLPNFSGFQSQAQIATGTDGTQELPKNVSAFCLAPKGRHSDISVDSDRLKNDKIELSPNGLMDAENGLKMANGVHKKGKATVGFEPTNNGFAISLDNCKCWLSNALCCKIKTYIRNSSRTVAQT